MPLNTRLVPAAATGVTQGEGYYLLARSPVIRGADIRDAHASQGQVGAWVTDFVLTQDAARKFERFTEANIGNRLAIVLDGKVIEAPVVHSKISDTRSEEHTSELQSRGHL